MNPFLPVFLLLGVAAILIPSASGLRCVHCKFWRDHNHNEYGIGDCNTYQKGGGNSSAEMEILCPLIPSEGKKSICIASRTKDPDSDDALDAFSGCKEVPLDTPLGCTKCKGPSGMGETCTCDMDICNRSSRMTLGGPGLWTLVILLGGLVGLG